MGLYKEKVMKDPRKLENLYPEKVRRDHREAFIHRRSDADLYQKTVKDGLLCRKNIK